MKYTIIGAGIGGLATAVAFEKQGVDYQVFEKARELHEVGAGIWLAPNALQVCEHLNILSEIKLAGNSIDRITIGKHDLSPLSDNDQDVMKDKFGYSTIAIHRAELQRVLLAQIPPEKLFFGKGFSSYEILDSGKIEIRFDDRTTHEADFLMGADGIHSRVRKQLFPQSEIRYSGQTCWRGVSDIKIEKDFEHRGLELWGDQVRFGFSRISANKVYWFAVALAKANQKDDEEQIRLQLLEKFRNFHPIVKSLIESTPIVLRNDINDLKPLDNWFKGNTCLIGDAGHATTPNMGQGGAQAIEDAYYLGQLIEKYPDQNVFRLFQQRRQSKVNMIVKQSWTTGKMAHWKYGKNMRNIILKNLPKKLLEKKMMELYSIDSIEDIQSSTN